MTGDPPDRRRPSAADGTAARAPSLRARLLWFLLAAIAYPRAEICLTTARARRAAESSGLYQ